MIKRKGLRIYHSTDPSKDKFVSENELRKMHRDLTEEFRNTVDGSGYNWLESVPLQRARIEFRKSLRVFGIAAAIVASLVGAVWVAIGIEPAAWVLLVGGVSLVFCGAYPLATFLHYHSMKD